MKKTIYLIIVFTISLIATSCNDDSATDEYEKVNGKVKDKLITSIALSNSENPEDNQKIIMSYNSNGTLNTINKDEENSIFIYDGDQLTNITGNEGNITIEDLYESPYQAFETGTVLNYDDNGNPKKIQFPQYEYDSSVNDDVLKNYTAEVTYDDAHNPYYSTLKSAGIISILDKVKFNFNPNPQSEDIVIARTLFPNNNPSQVTYKDEEGYIVFSTTINYVYDEDNYPTSATITYVSLEDNDSGSVSAIYTYTE